MGPEICCCSRAATQYEPNSAAVRPAAVVRRKLIQSG